MAKTVLYTFSATGNSLAAAQELGALLEDSMMVSIVGANGQEGGEKRQIIGVVTPVYHFGLPRLVAEFLNNTLAFSEQAYYFLVLTCGGMAGAAGVQAARILAQRQIPLSLCASVRMVDNYVPYYRIPSEERQEDILISADEKLRQIAARIAGQERLPARAILPDVQMRFHRRAIQRYADADRLFAVSNRCTRCGLCEQICPVDNIRIGERGLEFLHHCEQCLACLHWCPLSAIDIGHKSAQKGRYHHPRIRLADIKGLKLR